MKSFDENFPSEKKDAQDSGVETENSSPKEEKTEEAPSAPRSVVRRKPKQVAPAETVESAPRVEHPVEKAEMAPREIEHRIETEVADETSSAHERVPVQGTESLSTEP